MTTLDGKQELREVEFFRLSVLAESLDRKPDTIREWVKAGVFPKPMVKISGSAIWYYTAAQVIGMHRLWVKKYGGRTHLRDPQVFSSMMTDFRAVMSRMYLDRYVVSDEGEVNTERDFRPEE